jgi:glucosyl-3-phosphoglycerate synthase
LIAAFHHSDFPLDVVLERKRGTVTVVLPAREVADTIGPIVERLQSLEGLVDQILVVDAASEDGTAEIAARLGADVHQEAELMPELGRVLGKGDAMWRAQAAAHGDTIAYLDSDTREFPAHFATGILGPLITRPELEFVKAFFRRPFMTSAGVAGERDGGRVTELTARPLLSAFYPDLAGFIQPLAGEFAARRDLLQRLPFGTGYSVETAMLLNVRDALGGTGGMAQVDLEIRLNRHQPLPELGPMAYAVLGAILERLRREGRLTGEALPPFQAADGRLIQVEPVERPPFATLGAHA